MTTWMQDGRIPLLCLDCGDEVGEIRIENGKPDIWMNPDKRNDDERDPRILPNCGIELMVCWDCVVGCDGGLLDRAREEAFGEYNMDATDFNNLLTEMEMLGERVKNQLEELEGELTKPVHNGDSKIRKIRTRMANTRRKNQVSKLKKASKQLEESLAKTADDFPGYDRIPF